MRDAISRTKGALSGVELEISLFSRTYDAQIRSVIEQSNEWLDSFDDKSKMIRSISKNIKSDYGKLINLQRKAIKLRANLSNLTPDLSNLTPPIPEDLNEEIKKLQAERVGYKAKIIDQLSEFKAVLSVEQNRGYMAQD